MRPPLANDDPTPVPLGRADTSARLVWVVDDVEQTCELEGRPSLVVIGRSSRANVRIDDQQASRRHAEIYWEGRRWWLRDADSRNGTYLGTNRVTRPIPLAHGDTVRCGKTSIRFLWPASIRRGQASSQPETIAASAMPVLSTGELELLRELCNHDRGRGRPRSEPRETPPTNAEIASRLHLTEAAVRQRLKRLYPKFGLAGTESTKRTELVARAMEAGVVSFADN